MGGGTGAMTILILSTSNRAEQFYATARAQDPAARIRVWPDTGPVEDIRCVLAWVPPMGVMKTLPNLELIVSVGAGVDGILKDAELPDVPLVRYVDPDLTGRMVEYVVLHALFHHRQMCSYIEQQRRAEWTFLPEPAAHEVRVGVMGLGVMGQASIAGLRAIGYRINGWSRTQREIAGVRCFAGEEGLAPFLAETDVLACLLPLTPNTRGILNRRLIQGLSKTGRHPRLTGPSLINAGRGGLQVEADILAALDAGELHAASLDVFNEEPLPASSPFWAHPRVVITPHNAAESRPESIVRYMFRQIACQRAGKSLENLVDRGRGY